LSFERSIESCEEIARGWLGITACNDVDSIDRAVPDCGSVIAPVTVGRNAVEADGTLMCESVLDPCTAEAFEEIDFDFEIAIGTIGDDILTGVSAELEFVEPAAI